MAVGKRVFAVIAAFACLAGPVAAELIDAVVATVDKEAILHSDVMLEVQPLVADVSPDSNEFREIYNAALEQAIEQKILYREGVLNDIKITDEQVESRLEKYREQYKSEPEFLAALDKEGVTISEFREHVRKQMIALSMGLSKRHLLEREVVISEAELAQYYQDHLDTYQKPERVKLLRIFIAADQNEASRAKARARTEALREELSLGADFAQLAKTHSEGPDAAQGGFVGWIERGELIAALEEVAFSLNPGDISPIIETEYGVMLLKVEEKMDAGLASFDEVRTELEPELRQARANDRYQKWMSELRKRSRVRKFQ
jgi:peptidyl-prolyl cis-trans isomerase C